jgi:AcrR family transcriptional regulator
MSDRASDTKTHILNTSIHLFASQGYKETTIRNISKDAGVNVSMISYYFGGKDGILRHIVTSVTEELSSLLSQLDLEDVNIAFSVLDKLLICLETHRSQIKILFSELGKDNSYITPVTEEIGKLQAKLRLLTLGKNNTSKVSELEENIKILTDIMLGMIFSDYVFDFSSFQVSTQEEILFRREKRVHMLKNILKQLSGYNTGNLTFESIM